MSVSIRAVLVTVLFCVLINTSSSSLSASPMFPFGAYVAWERIVGNASQVGESNSKYLGRLLSELSHIGFNCVWVTNLPQSELSLFDSLASRHGLHPLVTINELRARTKGRDMSYYQAAVPRIVSSIAPPLYPYAWVLADEPSERDIDRVSAFGSVLRQQIPSARRVIVTNLYGYMYYTSSVAVDTICVDIYPFFGPNDPNGPHTPRASKNFFQSVTTSASKAILDSGKPFWVMLQAFSEVWGPWRYDSQYHVIGLPGAYVHWVQPSVSEIRWQFWQALRVGAKGVFFFLATPPPVNPRSPENPAPNVPWKRVLLKADFDAGSAAILNPDLTLTTTGKTIAELINEVRPIESELLQWKSVPLPILPFSKASAAAFAGSDGAIYVILINDDLTKSAAVEFGIDSSGRKIDYLSGGRFIVLMPTHSERAFDLYSIRLSPGDGAVLRVAPASGP